MTTRVAVLGASGFVGSAVVAALVGRVEVVPVVAPRLTTTARRPSDLFAIADDHPDRERLRGDFAGVDVVVNAAGDPDASSLDEGALFGANALMPAVALLAAVDAGVSKFVHVSSAVVQNDKPVLDSSEDLRPFSPYSASKVMGEILVRDAATEGIQVTRYRPPSVHAPNRRVTRMIRRVSTSAAATVAQPGTQPTPQALLPNVGAAVAFLALTEQPVPAAVHHPSEGVTTSSLMRDLSGGCEPRQLPVWLARLGVRGGKVIGRIHKPTAANARRVELLWLGQEQAPSWLSSVGWRPPVGLDGWAALSKEVGA